MTEDRHEKLLKPPEVAEMLGRTIDALAMMRYRKTGPVFVKTDGLVRYRPSAVEAYIDANTRDHT